MNCKCETLNITHPTDVPLLLRMLVGYKDEGQTGEPFPIELAEDVAVQMVSERGERVAVDFTVGDEGRVLLRLKGADFRVGVYGVDVTCRLNGAAHRAYGDSVIRYTFATVKGAESVTVGADPYEVTLYVGYVTDIVPTRTSELLNDGEDGSSPFATEEAVAALDRKFGNYIPTAQKGAANGVAELNAEGKVPTAQAQFALRGNVTAAGIDSTALQSGFYRIIGQRLGSDILGGDEANGVLIQYSDGYKEQVLMVGRTAGAAAGEQVETYTRRYLSGAKRWTAWSKGGGESDEIYFSEITQESAGVYKHDAAAAYQAFRDGKVVIGVNSPYYYYGMIGLNGYISYVNFSFHPGPSINILSGDTTDFLISYEVLAMDIQEAKDGTASTTKFISPYVLKHAILYHTSDLLSGKASTADVTALQQQVAGKQDAIQDLADIRAGAAAGATAVQPAALQPYATRAWVGEQRFLTEHQDISGKEDKMQVVAVYNTEDPSQPVTGVPCNLSTYYRIPVPIESLTLLLPLNPFGGYVENIVVYLTGGTAPAVTIRSADINPAPIYYHDGYAIESGKTYEVSILWNGAAWVVASVEIVINN